MQKENLRITYARFEIIIIRKLQTAFREVLLLKVLHGSSLQY